MPSQDKPLIEDGRVNIRLKASRILDNLHGDEKEKSAFFDKVYHWGTPILRDFLSHSKEDLIKNYNASEAIIESLENLLSGYGLHIGMSKEELKEYTKTGKIKSQSQKDNTRQVTSQPIQKEKPATIDVANSARTPLPDIPFLGAKKPENNKVKNTDKQPQKKDNKRKTDIVKSKPENKKKDKHKPFRRGHDIDLDSKVKSEFFSMRLSGKELDNLSKKAAKCHMSTSTYARETLLSSVPREALSEKDRSAMDKVYTMLEDANFNVRQMANHFHSMLSEKDKDGKAKYDRQTWNELKIVIQKQKAVLNFLDSEFRIYK